MIEQGMMAVRSICFISISMAIDSNLKEDLRQSSYRRLISGHECRKPDLILCARSTLAAAESPSILAGALAGGVGGVSQPDTTGLGGNERASARDPAGVPSGQCMKIWYCNDYQPCVASCSPFNLNASAITESSVSMTWCQESAAQSTSIS